MPKKMLIHLLEDFAATPSEEDVLALDTYIRDHFSELEKINPERSAEMRAILLRIEQILDEDFDSIKIYRIIDLLRIFR